MYVKGLFAPFYHSLLFSWFFYILWSFYLFFLTIINFFKICDDTCCLLAQNDILNSRFRGRNNVGPQQSRRRTKKIQVVHVLDFEVLKKKKSFLSIQMTLHNILSTKKKEGGLPTRFLQLPSMLYIAPSLTLF